MSKIGKAVYANRLNTLTDYWYAEGQLKGLLSTRNMGKPMSAWTKKDLAYFQRLNYERRCEIHLLIQKAKALKDASKQILLTKKEVKKKLKNGSKDKYIISGKYYILAK